MSRIEPINLPDSHIRERLLGLGTGVFWNHNSIPPLHLTSSFRPGQLIIDLVSTVEADKQQVSQEHQQKLATLEQDLDNTLKTQAGNLSGRTPLQSVETRLNTVGPLRKQFEQQLSAARVRANSFFGSPPEHKTFEEFRLAINRPGTSGEPRAEWLASYKAAFEAKRIERMIERLGSRENRLRLERAEVLFAMSEANTVSNLILQTDRTLIRFTLAKHQYQQSKTQLQSLLQAFQRHQHDDIAEGAALAHAAELELETSALIKTRLDLQLQYFAADLDRGRMQGMPPWIDRAVTSRRQAVPRANELLKLKSQILAAVALHDKEAPNEKRVIAQLRDSANRAIRAAFDEQTYLSTLSGITPSNSPVTFQAWTASTTHPLVLAPTRGGTAHFEAVLESFAKLTNAAGTALLRAGARKLGRFVSLMTYSAHLGNGERMGVTVPLVQMTPGTDLALQANRHVGQTLALPLRLSVAPVGDKSEIYMVATDGEAILRDVRVGQAEWDAGQGAYRFTSQGPGAATIFWHPQTPPSTLYSQNPKTGEFTPGTPIVEDLQKHYPGSISVPREVDIRTLPVLPDRHIDDYIVVFPADSGLAPIYVMFRDPRTIAGVASGQGALTPDRVLDSATTAEGAPIPSRIAEKLKGRRFSRFDKLREAIWIEIASDEVFNQHLAPLDIDNMRNGLAPYAPESHWVGRRIKLEIHHKNEVAKGGAVYDLDNLVLMTPSAHIGHHRENKQ